VRNSVGKIVMECVIETKASTILQFIDGLMYDLLKPHVTEVLVCNTRKNLSRKQGLPVIAFGRSRPAADATHERAEQ